MLRSVIARTLVVGIAGTAMLAVAPARAAAAWGRPDPLAVPGSVVGSLDNLSSTERARLVGNTLPADVRLGRVPVTVATSTTPTGAGSAGGFYKGGVKMVGGAATAATGFSLGWSVGSGIASLMGYDTQGAWASLTGTVPAVGYTANPDITGLPEPGWTPGLGNWTGLPGTYCTGGAGSCGSKSGTYSLQVHVGTTPGYAAPVPASSPGLPSSMVSSWSLDAAADFVRDFNGSAAGITVWAICRLSGTSTYGTCGTSGMGTGPDRSGSRTVTLSTYHGSGSWVFDHLAFFRSGVDPLPTMTATTPGWFPEGHQNRPPEPDGDPMRLWETRWTCTGGGSGTDQSVAFSEGDASWPKPPSAVCTSGEVASVEIWEVTPTNRDLDVKVSSWEASPAVQDWRAAYPECANGACLLELWRVTNDTRVNCFTDPGVCAKWWSDPAKATNYQCTYGGHDVALTECNAYRPTFDSAVNTTTPYADPKTGDLPAGGTTPDPTPDDGCPPDPSIVNVLTGWILYKGAVCALEWAFVPKSDVKAQVTGLGGVIGNKPPFSWFTDGADTLNPAGLHAGAGCPSWQVKVGPLEQSIVCDSSFIQALANMRPVLLGLMILSAFAPLIRSIWYAVLPFVRVIPTGGQ